MRGLVFVAALSACQQSLPPPPPPAARAPRLVPPAPAKPPSLAQELAALGRAEIDARTAERQPVRPCAPLAPDREQALRARLATWIESETKMAVEPGAVDVTFGCDVADVHVDVRTSSSRWGEWWIVRIGDAHITVLETVSGTALDDWMEWADERSVTTLAEVDLDGDGRLDPVASLSQHEGGATKASYELRAHLSATGRVLRFARFHGALDLPLGTPRAGGRLVLAIDQDDKRTYRCVAATGLVDCPEAGVARRADDAVEAADALRAVTPETVPDRATLARQLEALDVPAAERARLLAKLAG